MGRRVPRCVRSRRWRRAARLNDPAGPPDQRSSGAVGAQSYCVGLHCAGYGGQLEGGNGRRAAVWVLMQGALPKFSNQACGKPG